MYFLICVICIVQTYISYHHYNMTMMMMFKIHYIWSTFWYTFIDMDIKVDCWLRTTVVVTAFITVVNNAAIYGKQQLDTAAGSKFLRPCFKACCLWNSCFKIGNQICDHSQSVADFEATLVSQDGDKVVLRQNQFTISLQLNGAELAITCDLLVII